MFSYLLGRIGDKELRENIAFSLAFGLAFGLAGGLAGGLAFGLAFPWWVVLLLVLLSGELFFFFDKSKIGSNDIPFLFTLRHKLEALIESALVVVNLSNLVWIYPDIIQAFHEYYPTVLRWIDYLGVLVIALLVFTGYIWLNSLRYHKTSKKKTSKNG